MSDIQAFLDLARKHGGSDLHIMASVPVMARIKGELTPISKDRVSPEAARHLAYGLLTKDQVTEFEITGDFDTMLTDDNGDRYRVNVCKNDGCVGAVIRLLPAAPMQLESLKLPELVTRMTTSRKGLILITGSTSQGKSTTMAGMIDYLNRNSRKHIITIEDPIEYVHPRINSIVRQRGVGHDTESFSMALRAALRQDPDVIAIGEMRDYDTIKTALTASETGVLVISSLHVISIDKLIERLLAYAPDGSDGHMRALIAESLICVIHQELLPTLSGGKRVACETLTVTDAVRNMIRKGNTFQLRSVIATGQRFGMQLMRTSLDQLLEEEEIEESTHAAILRNYPD